MVNQKLEPLLDNAKGYGQPERNDLSPVKPPAADAPEDAPPPPEPPAGAARRGRRRDGCCSGPELGSRDQAPEYQRRPFILNGYRLHTTGCARCLRSAVALHNETLNIWTHLLGLLPVAWWASGLQSRLAALLQEQGPGTGLELGDWICLAVLYALTLNCLFFSAFYHARHCDVESICFGCFYLDIGGVVLLVVASLGVGVWICFRAFPLLRLGYVTAVLGLLPAMGIPMICGELSDGIRAAIFAACAVSGLIPALHWVLISSLAEVQVLLPFILGVLVSYGCGALIYATRFPESLWPGRFDYAGQSHNLWHMCVFAGMVVWLTGMERMAVLYAAGLPASP